MLKIIRRFITQTLALSETTIMISNSLFLVQQMWGMEIWTSNLKEGSRLQLTLRIKIDFIDMKEIKKYCFLFKKNKNFKETYSLKTKKQITKPKASPPHWSFNFWQVIPSPSLSFPFPSCWPRTPLTTTHPNGPYPSHWPHPDYSLTLFISKYYKIIRNK